jgi:hypothetical protein
MGAAKGGGGFLALKRAPILSGGGRNLGGGRVALGDNTVAGCTGVELPDHVFDISPFQPVNENWNAVTFSMAIASRPSAPDAG